MLYVECFLFFFWFSVSWFSKIWFISRRWNAFLCMRQVLTKSRSHLTFHNNRIPCVTDKVNSKINTKHSRRTIHATQKTLKAFFKWYDTNRTTCYRVRWVEFKWSSFYRNGLIFFCVNLVQIIVSKSNWSWEGSMFKITNKNVR